MAGLCLAPFFRERERPHRPDFLMPVPGLASLNGLVGVARLPFELAYAPSKDALDSLGYLCELVVRPFGLELDFRNADTARQYGETRGPLLGFGSLAN